MTRIRSASVSLGGGLAVRDGRTSSTSEATLYLQNGLRKLSAQVIMRELKPRELTFEILNISLGDLSRYRNLLIEHSAGAAAPAVIHAIA